MSNLLNELITESADFTKHKKVAARLAAKWDRSGLLKGLEGYDKSNTAVMLESQAKQLVTEAVTTGGGVVGATFTTGVGEQWAGVALPLVRKIFGMIASKDFVSVQPMNLPAGLVFYLDFQYGNDKLPFNASGSLFGATSQVGQSSFGNTTAGGLYGAGRYGYSSNQFVVTSGSATAGAGLVFNSASFSDVNFNALYSSSVGNIKYIQINTGSLTDFDQNAIRSFVVTGSNGVAVSASNNLQEFTVISGSNIQFYFLNPGVTTGSYAVHYSKQTDFNKRGDFEDRTSTQGTSVPNSLSATQIVIPTIAIQMRSEAISAKTRKLKAEWTPELAQDLDKFQNIDAEAELTSMLGEYIALEIDLEILDMLIQNVPTSQVDVWSTVANRFYSLATGTWQDKAAGAGGYYNTQGGWFQTMGTKMQKLSNIIHQKTLRGGANFLVVSPAVATIIEAIPGFASDSDGAADTMKFAFGVQKVGSFNNRYKVYKNPYFVENLILMGLRGSQFLECGAVYAPYVPLIMTPLVYDPVTFTPKKGIMTRYAKKMVRPEFFAKLWVADLDQV